MLHPRLLDVFVMAGITVAATHCVAPPLCTPETAEVGFFSKGDCALTNASAFRGHEWLTLLGNDDIPAAADRFRDAETRAIIEGNRRVDWPKELLVFMAQGVVAYTNAANAFQDRVEAQPIHFLLDDVNETPDARVAGNAVMRERTRRGVSLWTSDRVLALTLFGQACHTLQDSFSRAHADRDPAHPTAPWCVRSIKVYLERAPGHELPPDRIHGGLSGDTIGHTTTLDSIYRVGRDCNNPLTRGDIDRCLSDEARRARLATRDYLAIVHDLTNRDALSEVDEKLDAFFAEHTPLCPP
jgi:hypothetical protein